MGEKKDILRNILGSSQLLPQEERLAVSFEKKTMTIGIPKELFYQERRVVIVPSAAAMLVENGNRVLIERGAGEAANFPDMLYSEAGAEIVDTAGEAFKCDVVVKIVPPTPDELAMMRDRVILVSALYFRGQRREYFRRLMKKKITALSYEHIRDRSNTHPVLHSISEIVGNAAVLIGAEYLSDSGWGRGKMLGGFTGINPSEVIIIGAGTVGENAARAALGFGALVKIFDDSHSKLARVQNNLGGRVYTSIIQPDVLSKSLLTADVVIGALYPVRGRNNLVITEEMVKKMKKGSVIVDVSIDKGGCSETSRETSHDKPVYKLHGVTHYCVPNISSRTPHTSSYAISNFMGPFLSDLTDAGGLIRLLAINKGVRNGVYTFKGHMVMESISEYFNLPYYNLELLLASY
jgi:alanine dehydrogenase